MPEFGVTAKLVSSFCFIALCAIGPAAQSQPDAQAGAQLGEQSAGAQLGEQSALAGKQAQGTNIQKSSELSPTGATRFVAGTLINAELTRSVDSKKVKQGDAVEARTVDDIKSTDGRLILPKGTKIVGHVTEASARNGKTDASLGLVFDKAVPKDGQEIPLNAGLQAVGAPPSAFPNAQDTSQLPDSQPLGGSARGPGGGAPGISPGTGSTGGSPQGTATGRNSGAAPNITGESKDAGQWNANTRGVVGLNHLTLSAANANGAPGSVITSTSKSVHLDGDTRLILVTHDVPAKEVPLK